MDDSQVHSACRREIEELHDFFVSWYSGECDTGDFERVEAVIAPGFAMVTPDGNQVERDAVLGMVRDGRDQYEHGGFEIDVRNVEVVANADDYAVARYEEWQTSSDEFHGRISTVLFRSDPEAPNGLVWLTLHETWLDGE